MNGCVVLKPATEVSALVMDKTRSMAERDLVPSRLEAAKEAALEFIRRKPLVDVRDRTAVIAFDVEARVISPFGRHPFEAQRDVQALAPSGNTNITKALRLALDIVTRESKGLVKPVLRAVLLSDGEHNTGPGPLEDGIVKQMRRAGVVVDTISVGGSGADLLRRVSQITGGEFATVRDFQALLQHYRGLADKKPLPPRR